MNSVTPHAVWQKDCITKSAEKPRHARSLSSSRVIGPVVRAKDLVKMKGMLVNPAVLLETLGSIGEISEFQVLIQKPAGGSGFAMDELVIRIAVEATDRAAIEKQVVAATAAAVGVRPLVEFASANDIYDPTRETKAVRFIDRRAIQEPEAE